MSPSGSPTRASSLVCGSGPAGLDEYEGLACYMPEIDDLLRQRNLVLERALLDAADAYYAAEDIRWFFAYSHGMITKQINRNLAIFEDPNGLLTLNIHFAEEFVRAIDGGGHERWKEAFRVCHALQEHGEYVPGQVEACAARMADVHIHVDLVAALRDVGCISARDYGNMLVFVNRGALAATNKLRGHIVGTAATMIMQIVGPLMDLDVKAWRNAAFEAACGRKVPNPDSPFPVP
jgi:hypothetical protein